MIRAWVVLLSTSPRFQCGSARTGSIWNSSITATIVDCCPDTFGANCLWGDGCGPVQYLPMLQPLHVEGHSGWFPARFEHPRTVSICLCLKYWSIKLMTKGITHFDWVQGRYFEPQCKVVRNEQVPPHNQPSCVHWCATLSAQILLATCMIRLNRHIMFMLISL